MGEDSMSEEIPVDSAPEESKESEEQQVALLKSGIEQQADVVMKAKENLRNIARTSHRGRLESSLLEGVREEEKKTRTASSRVELHLWLSHKRGLAGHLRQP